MRSWSGRWIAARTAKPIAASTPSISFSHWTLTKLCGYLREEKQLDLTYRTLNRYLHEHRYARKIPRRMPEPPDREALGEKIFQAIRSVCRTHSK